MAVQVLVDMFSFPLFISYRQALVIIIIIIFKIIIIFIIIIKALSC